MIQVTEIREAIGHPQFKRIKVEHGPVMDKGFCIEVYSEYENKEEYLFDIVGSNKEETTEELESLIMWAMY